MTASREQRFRDYLNLIASRMGGIDAVLAHYGDMAESPGGGLEATTGSRVQSPRGGLEKLATGGTLNADEMSGLEAIILPDLRPVIDISDGKFETAHRLWAKLSTDAAIRTRIEALLPSVGRIELPGLDAFPYGGTGFVVGNGLLMTNRHVAQIFAQGLGDRQIAFRPGRSAGIDFLRESNNTAGQVFSVRRVRMIHPFWDMAILEVEGLAADHRPVPLSLTDARDLAGTDVVVIGYPAFDSRNPADVQNDLLAGRFGVKRLQPGLLQGAFNTDSFGKIVPAATHDCSTLGGNSGSALFNLASGEVVGLHFAGRYQERNYAVPSSALAQDSRVVDAGVAFAGKPGGGGNDWGTWWQRADRKEAVGVSASAPAAQAGAGIVLSSRVSSATTSVTFEIPLRIVVSLASPAAAPVTLGTETATEIEAPGASVVPRTIADYADRKGYDPNFLTGGGGVQSVVVPMPDAADAMVLAPIKDGGTTLLYQNFSVKMHAGRRLALLTASNVTDELALREPEPGRDYSRKGLFTERWFPDLRLDSAYQLPDAFFDEDGSAFDKGHVVRRDDVAWGASFGELLKGNVDSFHGTNCSPQTAAFNRSISGADNWGDLENHVLSEAASERLCVFAGPVLSDDDRTFVGRGAKGAVLRARIPQSFWKVVVAAVSDGIAAYGFLLEQDLSDTPLEFAVAGNFIRSMHRLREIEELTGVAFDQSLHNTDQYETVRGVEIALRAGVKRIPPNQPRV